MLSIVTGTIVLQGDGRPHKSGWCVRSGTRPVYNNSSEAGNASRHAAYMSNRIAAIVGMAGAGKSEVSSFLSSRGLQCIHFGDVTQEELVRRGLPVNEANERLIREAVRAAHGMAAYALLNLQRIDSGLELGSVVVDGLYSWEEYLVLKARYCERLVVVAVTASPATRARRLSTRPVRPLTCSELAARDRAEIENLNKGGPIAMADIMLLNEGTVQELLAQAEQVLEAVG